LQKEQLTYGIIKLDVKVISHYGRFSKAVGGAQNSIFRELNRAAPVFNFSAFFFN